MALTNDQIKQQFLGLYDDVVRGVFSGDVQQAIIPLDPAVEDPVWMLLQVATGKPGVHAGIDKVNKYLALTFPAMHGVLVFEQRRPHNLDDPTIYISAHGSDTLSVFLALNGPAYLTENGLKLLVMLLEMSSGWEALDDYLPPWEHNRRARFDRRDRYDRRDDRDRDDDRSNRRHRGYEERSAARTDGRDGAYDRVRSQKPRHPAHVTNRQNVTMLFSAIELALQVPEGEQEKYTECAVTLPTEASDASCRIALNEVIYKLSQDSHIELRDLIVQKLMSDQPGWSLKPTSPVTMTVVQAPTDWHVAKLLGTMAKGPVDGQALDISAFDQDTKDWLRDMVIWYWMGDQNTIAVPTTLVDKARQEHDAVLDNLHRTSLQSADFSDKILPVGTTADDIGHSGL